MALDTQMASYYSDICELLNFAANFILRNNVGGELTLKTHEWELRIDSC